MFLYEDKSLPFSSLEPHTSPENTGEQQSSWPSLQQKSTLVFGFLLNTEIPETISLFSFSLPLSENKIGHIPFEFHFFKGAWLRLFKAISWHVRPEHNV